MDIQSEWHLFFYRLSYHTSSVRVGEPAPRLIHKSSHPHAQGQPHAHEHSHHRRTSITHERQRDSHYGHKSHDHPKIAQNMKCYQSHVAHYDQRARPLARCFGHGDQPPDQHQVQHHQHHD